MAFQRLKISACGHELGSDMVFSRRIGFSGTPSNLLPLDLSPCQYEPGSDGQIIAVLTDPQVVDATQVKRGWDARSLLATVAAAEPPYHALIDTGALVTGMENLEVAEALLEGLPPWFEGVVYLDKLDRQMVLLRASGRSVPLGQCGTPPDRRFSFYDQIHTTGMDIKQAPNARAALTIGKDMVFRDYAQGAWRMRGIGIGQTVTLLLIPEVMHRIEQELAAVPGLFKEGSWELNVPAWLLLNSLRLEGLQAVQLALQELHNVYRKRALVALVIDAVGNRAMDELQVERLVQLFGQEGAILAGGRDPEVRAKRFASGAPRAAVLTTSIDIFREHISHDIATEMPEPKSFQAVVDEKLASYGQDAAKILGLNDADKTRIAAVRSRFEGTNDDVAAVRGGLDTTRTQQQEREQQQEQMKEREQEEEEMSQFCRDDEQPLAWRIPVVTRAARTDAAEAAILASEAEGKEFPFGELIVGDDAFYPLALFRATQAMPALPFPRNLLLSSNYFRPRWAGLGDRRLKNIALVLEWCFEAQRNVAAISLVEAETIRRAIHTGEYGVYDESGTRIERKPLQASLALRTLAGHRLDATPTFVAGPEEELASWLQCFRFFHGDMFYSDKDLNGLMKCVSAAPHAEREQFFAETLRRRRRERREWADTPVARVFVEEAKWAELRPRALLDKARANLHANFAFVRKQRQDAARLQEVMTLAPAEGDGVQEHVAEQAWRAESQLADIFESIERYPGDVEDAFARFTRDEGGHLTRPGLSKMLKALGVQATALEVAEVMRICKCSIETSGDNASIRDGGAELSLEEFRACFDKQQEASKAAEEEGGWSGPWWCVNPRCPAWNNPDLFNVPEAVLCLYCEEQPRPDLVASGAMQAAGPPRGFWACPACTLNNLESLGFCSECGTARGAVVHFGDDENYE